MREAGLVDVEAVAYLRGDEAGLWLAALAADPVTPENHLHWAMRLRAAVGPERTQLLLETALLRRRAEAKFSRAGAMLFTRQALEQASAEIVSRYRASVFAAAGIAAILELGTGIGGDALSLAAVAPVLGVERDAVRLAMAEHNVDVYGHGDRFRGLPGNALALAPEAVQAKLGAEQAALFLDPGRRDDRGRRLRGLGAYRPPVMDVVGVWRERLAGICVKVSPAVDYGELPPGAEVEFVSVSGEVREGVLWFGALQRGSARRATLLPGGQTVTSAEVPVDVPVTAPGRYLYEPDGALIRAHLVEAVAERLGATKIDAEIAYLTADALQDTALARAFELEAALPFRLKTLRRYLQERAVGSVTIKKRGSPLDVETLRGQLRLKGPAERTLFLTRVRGEPTVLIGWPAAADGGLGVS